ncbi:MAG: sulfatase [Spirochaetia bacterium]|nr:sulfatase [Spirochaetia bacterium]
MSKPNIIIFNCDDLGYGDLGCYGSKTNRTPYLDRMAEEGIRFTDFYMASPVCTPSRGAMMTGCYPPRIGFGEFDGEIVLFPGKAYGLHEQEKTLPQYLKDYGYNTKIIGKWHCGDQKEFLPTNRGFDEYYGLPYSNDMGCQEGSGKFPPLPLVRDNDVIQEQPDQTSLTERYTEEAVQFLRREKNNPFFLYFAHMYVHVPLFVPHRFLKSSRNGGYGGAVEHIDWTVGAIIHELEKLNLTDDTLIIFTSDNGSRARDEGGSNAPCRGTKSTTWEGGMRVPLIIKWPNKIRPGQVSAELASSIDLLPTIVSLTGGSISDNQKIDGVDISGLFTDETAKSPRTDFAYYNGNRLHAVRKGDWKLHFYRNEDGDVKELYNLKDDIGENVNLYQQHPDIVSNLEIFAKKVRFELGDELTGIKGAEVREKGYIENPHPLTEYDPNHPYMVAMYDLEDAQSKVMSG